MQKSEPIQDHFSKASSIVNKMISFREKITDETIVSKILRTLTT